MGRKSRAKENESIAQHRARPARYGKAACSTNVEAGVAVLKAVEGAQRVDIEPDAWTLVYEGMRVEAGER